MSDTRAKITKLTSGIDKLDLILGGGIPEFSFRVIMGVPGSGKTTLAHQVIFANATPEKPALYFTVLGEPTIKCCASSSSSRSSTPRKSTRAFTSPTSPSAAISPGRSTRFSSRSTASSPPSSSSTRSAR